MAESTAALPATTGYTGIKAMYFKFKKHIHPQYEQAHTHLTDAFASNIDIDTLFIDGDNRTIWKQNPLNTIRLQISQIIIELTSADEGFDLTDNEEASLSEANHVTSLITSLAINTRTREGSISIRSTKDIQRAFDSTLRDTNNQVITILLHIDSLRFKKHFNPLNIYEWGQRDRVTFPEWHKGDTNGYNDTDDLPADEYTLKHAMHDFRELLSPEGKYNKNNHVDRGRAQAPITAYDVFNYKAMPSDVQDRYQSKQNRELVRGSALVPFKTNIPTVQNPSINMTQLYYLDPPATGERLITRDGSYFHLRDQGGAQEKLFIQNTPICTGNSPAEIRAWYMAFTVHAASKGYYIHPYFCFRTDSMNSNFGFSAGIDDDYINHDLPVKYGPNLETWSQKVYQAISNDRIFPKGTCDRQRDIINNHYGGRGYEALLAIIRDDLPIYQSNPTKYIRDIPRQNPRETLDRYYFRYVDYLQLRAHLKDITLDLNHKGELDDFIQGTIYSDEFIRLTREDRKSKDPHVLQHFSQSMILNTLNKLQKEDILPMQRKIPPITPPIARRNNDRRFQTPTQNTFKQRNRNRSPKETRSPQEKDKKMNLIDMDPEDPLASLEIPENSEAFETYIDNYQNAVINNVNTDPRSFDTSKPCLVCGQSGHTFDNCGVLNNLAYMQRHYISWKIYLAKAHKRQQEALTDQKINRLESQYRDMSLDNFDEEEMVFSDDDENEDNPDFQEGDY